MTTAAAVACCSGLPCLVLPIALLILASAATAVAGGSSVRVIDLSGEMLELRGDAVELDPGQVATAVGWTPDGQLLTVATTVSCSSAGRCMTCSAAECYMLEGCTGALADNTSALLQLPIS